jgi:hypothetical protein
MRAAIFATALLGVLALAVPGVDAKKKHKGGKSSSVTVTAKTPIAIPPATTAKTSLVAVPLIVGKKAKNMLVSVDSVAVTYSLTGAPGTGAGPYPDGSLWETDLSLAAPNGRTVDLDPPGWSDEDATATGPTTETANSPFFPCRLDNTGVPGTSFCDPTADQDPEGTLTPPNYVGTMGNVGLAWFASVRAKGTWILKARNYDWTKGSTLTGISLRIGLTASSSGGSKKK